MSLIRLSQGHLNLLNTCPRKFQHIYCDRLTAPLHPEQEEKMAWGSHFHLLMQQKELGLPIGAFLETDEKLKQWVDGVTNAIPEIFEPSLSSFRDSEHCRTLEVEGYLLTVIYDLLITSSERAEIIDWKTYPQPTQFHQLAQDWQTKLYLYVLAETSEYLPEQISMTYWFVQSQPQPKSHKFVYSRQLHTATKKELSAILKQLDKWLENYHQNGINFPLVAESAGYCQNCNFAVRCDRLLSARDRDRYANLVLDCDAIEEIPL
ncbi:PD-(D/E)XK nuclease family protein [Merismopedia glauca]|uniref:PD-(D/E)XK nuclease family protein n=1 Tax=Merismopedia glauca CCAP 1448/3 TaxID=1296344 RepID=A0A2T1C101_9CYAN|nr:PD-(D/E)XK nuclease family protein [Merismopedia glauca]PSB01940.1 PD-(D/E)XK nuclease family protein [Merismopedia glauca CCAP 1448/3]